MTNPNDIADTYTTEMSKIIEHLAPQQRVLLNKKNKIHISKGIERGNKISRYIFDDSNGNIKHQRFWYSKS